MTKTAAPGEVLPFQNPHAVRDDARDNNLERAIGHEVRTLRKKLGITGADLASATGISLGMLSKIENGKASPSLPMLHRIIKVLDKNIGWFFEESHGEEGMIFRVGTRPVLTLDPLRRGKGIALERIIPYSPGHLLQCNIHHVEVGGESAGPIQHVGEEVGYVIAGEVELIVGERSFHLVEGDAFAFNSDLPHHYRNAGDRRASIFWVNTPATF